METIVFDIETGPLPLSELEAIMPPFDASDVKCGNLKDPEKIQAKIAEARNAHREDFIRDAPLCPLTGRVLAIGLMWMDTKEIHIIGDQDEATLLSKFWGFTRGEMGRTHTLMGFNSNNFDLPFLIRRSWKHRVRINPGVRNGRYWANQVIDLRETWQMGDRMAKGNLNALCRHLGLGEKNGNGGDFHRLWETDKEAAIEYLRQDILLTAKVAEVLFGY